MHGLGCCTDGADKDIEIPERQIDSVWPEGEQVLELYIVEEHLFGRLGSRFYCCR